MEPLENVIKGCRELRALLTSVDEQMQAEREKSIYEALEENPDSVLDIDGLAYDDEYAQELEALSLKFN